MSGFDLPNSYTDNLEALLRKSRSCTASSSATPPTVEPITPKPSSTTAMAKTLHDYSTPAIANMPVGPTVQHVYWKLRAMHWPHHDGAGKPILWFAKRGRKCTLATLPGAV